jgi:hypothetical protein
MSPKGLLVFHSSKEAFPKTIFFNESRAEQLIGLFNDGEFTPVAILPQGATKDEANDSTQNTEKPWTIKPGVRDIDKTVQKRSTSVGDVIVDIANREAYAVIGDGFLKLDDKRLNLDGEIGNAKNLIQKDMRREHNLGKSLNM